MRRNAEEQDAGATADLQDPPGPQRQNPFHGVIYLLLHYFCWNRLFGVAAHPTGQVERHSLVGGSLVFQSGIDDLVISLLPLRGVNIEWIKRTLAVGRSRERVLHHIGDQPARTRAVLAN